MPYMRTLTPRQETFCQLIAEGIYTQTEAARRAGFAETSASAIGARMLNGSDYPHVIERIVELKEQRQRRYGVTMEGQLERLHQLSAGAEEAGQFSAAINAEKIRSALGGLTIDRRETINTLDQLSRDEITARLAKLAKEYPQAFALAKGMKDVTPNGDRTRGQAVALTQVEDAAQLDG